MQKEKMLQKDTKSPQQRYDPRDFALLHTFDALYFAHNFAHNLVCGVPVFPVTETVNAAAHEYLAKRSYRYSRVDGDPAFRAALSGFLEKKGLGGQSLIATAGGTGGLLLAMMSILESGDEVLVFDPDYPGYRRLASALGAVPMSCPLGGDYRISAGQVEKYITPRTRLIIFSNPSNPLGLVTTSETLSKIVMLARACNAWVISDEVYADFTHGTGFSSVAGLGENVVAVRSFSKSAGLAAWRIGYCIGADGIVSRMRDLQEYTFVCAPVPSQHVAAAFLLQQAADTSVFVARRKIVCDMLWEARVPFVEPEAAFFAYVHAPAGGGLKFAKWCFENGVAVLPGAMFSNRDTHVRISFAGDWPQTQDAVRAFIQLYQRALREFS